MEGDGKSFHEIGEILQFRENAASYYCEKKEKKGPEAAIPGGKRTSHFGRKREQMRHRVAWGREKDICQAAGADQSL